MNGDIDSGDRGIPPRARDDRRGAADERQLELERDRLVELVGQFLARRSDWLLATDERFLRWWGEELRGRQSPAERLRAERMAGRFAAEVLARLDASALPVRAGGARPVERRPPVEGTVTAVLAACARERLAPWLDVAVAAGAGRELWDEPCERCVEVPAELGHGEHVAFTVVGDSMTPLLHAGDVVLAEVTREVRPRSIVVVRRPDGGYVVKAAGRVDRRTVELRSANPAFAPVTIPRDDCLVVGTVVMRWCPHGGDPPCMGGVRDERSPREGGD